MKKNLIILSFFMVSFTFAQNHSIDSLLNALKIAKHDTVRARIYASLSEHYSIFKMDTVIPLSNEALAIVNKNLNTANEKEKHSYLISKATAINNIGFIYYYQGKIKEALANYEISLKIREEVGDKKGMGSSLNNIGIIYKNQGDIAKALEYYSRSLQLQQEVGDKEGIASSLNNIGVIYSNKKDFSKALEYYEKSLQLREEIGDKHGMAYSLNSMGFTYNKQNDFLNALDCYNKSLYLRKEIGDKKGIATSYSNIAANYLKQKKFLFALSYADSSLAISKEVGYPENIRNAERILAKIDSARGNYAGAFEHYKQYIVYRDSLNNENTRKASIKSQLNYEFDKKEAIIKEQQDKERAIANEKDRFQQIVIWSVITGFLLVLVFVVFIFRTLKTTRLQKAIIEEKQKEILDSIHYAKRIQTSLLPSEKYIERNLMWKK